MESQLRTDGLRASRRAWQAHVAATSLAFAVNRMRLGTSPCLNSALNIWTYCGGRGWNISFRGRCLRHTTAMLLSLHVDAYEEGEGGVGSIAWPMEWASGLRP